MDNEQSPKAPLAPEKPAVTGSTTTTTVVPPRPPSPDLLATAARCPLDPNVKKYVVDRLRAAGAYLANGVAEAIGVVGGHWARRRCEQLSIYERIEQLQQLLNVLGRFKDVQTLAEALDACRGAAIFKRGVLNGYCESPHGAAVDRIEDSIFRSRTAAIALNDAIRQLRPRHRPKFERPAKTVDEGKSTGQLIRRRMKDLYHDDMEREFHEALASHNNPNL